jgi:Glycosyl hydrolases family 38 N-terminal domain
MAASQLNQRRTLGTAPSSNHSAPDDSRVTNSNSNRRQRPASRRTNATNPYNQSHQTLPATIFVTVLIIGISLWLLIPLILAKHTTIFHGLRVTTASASNQDQNVDNNPQHMVDPDTHPEEAQLAPPEPRSAQLTKAENELIDMRNLNQKLPFANPDGGAWKQGWEVLPKPYSKENPLTVYVLPHSHCDPGWIKTFDEYFQQQTKQILTTVVDALVKHPKRKFIWAEISYFEWWYREQSAEVKTSVKQLLASKQLEFVTGGWVQPDEANTELYAMEVQLQEGHDWIKETFGAEYIPRFGWSIDPFGYSPTMAYLLEKYGFKGMLIQRVHYAIKKELAHKQHLEFMWR